MTTTDHPTWTRSIQRVEGLPVVVDIRPGLPSLTIFVGCPVHGVASGLELRVALACHERLGSLMPSSRITVRIDSGIELGEHDLIDTISRALRSHQAGVSVEQMDATILR